MLNQIKQRHQGKKIYITEGNLFKGNSTGKDFIQSKKERFYIQDIGERSIYQGSEWSIPVSMSES